MIYEISQFTRFGKRILQKFVNTGGGKGSQARKRLKGVRAQE
jgi:hypothetical protein